MRHYAGSALILLVTLAAAIGSYTINLKVSAERAAVESLRRQLVADARDMRNLQAELRTRARLPEMQRWNDNVLLMAAPAAGQFLRSPLQLASFGAAPAPTEAPALRYAVTTPEGRADTVTSQVTRASYIVGADAVSIAAPSPGVGRPAATETPRVVRVAYAPVQFGNASRPLPSTDGLASATEPAAPVARLPSRPTASAPVAPVVAGRAIAAGQR
jgi:hypothetical protein